jgi:GT2 family glycosyltransferase
VLDSPELADDLSDLASQLHAFHGIPFRLVRLTHNSGFGTAHNLGASVARGRLLLLLNSDVVPDRPGWLDELAAFYDATPEIGALGPKLLYEDDSIQHAGMYFEREIGTGVWGNLHYFKGLARGFPPATVSRAVPAVTGACLMIDRALFEELGGFSHLHLRGGYEDSELSLRLLARGLRNWYLAGVELYHLEGQVHPTPSAAATVKYATWLQTRLWGDLIEQTMREAAATAEVPQSA